MITPDELKKREFDSICLINKTICSFESRFDTAIEKGKIFSDAGGYISAEFIESEIEEKAIIEYAAEFGWEVVFCVSGSGKKEMYICRAPQLKVNVKDRDRDIDNLTVTG